MARSIVDQTLANLIPDPNRRDDCLVMVSELATNAWLHGLRGVELDDQHAPPAGRSELAIYRRGAGSTAELVVTVFDPDPDVDAIPTPEAALLTTVPEVPDPETLPDDVLDDVLKDLTTGRRGLDLVRTLSDGRFGFYRTRSRLGAFPVPGKAAWFAIPAGPLAARPPAITMSPDQALHALAAQLDARGIGRTYQTDSPGESVLSLPSLSVWCRDQTLRWSDGDRIVRLPLYDLVEAVEQIIKISEDTAYATTRTP